MRCSKRAMILTGSMALLPGCFRSGDDDPEICYQNRAERPLDLVCQIRGDENEEFVQEFQGTLEPGDENEVCEPLDGGPMEGNDLVIRTQVADRDPSTETLAPGFDRLTLVIEPDRSVRFTRARA